MQSNTKYNLSKRNSKSSIQDKGAVAVSVRITCRVLLSLVIAFVLMTPLTAMTWASDQTDTGDYANLDARWLPWIGSWRLVPGTVDTGERATKEEYLLTVSPGDSGKSVIMKGYRDETVLSEEEIIADGLRHSLIDDTCTGWYMYSWSKTGKRLLFNSESSCTGDISNLISGMSIIDNTGDWLDIQLLQSGEEKAITVRRYRNVDNAPITPGRVNAADKVFARISAGVKFSISEIIELSSIVEPEVLEAALLELGKPFPINSKQLIRLADAKVPSQIIDLMVALSFPDKFTVERATIAEVQSSEYYHPDMYPPPPPYGHPLHSWYWDSYMYYPYDYWYVGWNRWPGWYHTYWGRPYYGGGDYVIDTGRLVEGHGYTRATPDSSGSSPRQAQPRNAPEGQGVASRPTSSFSQGTSSYSSSGGSTSESSSTSESESSYASPSGYSRGNSD